jgi:predicted PurR-regulated permease PerM
VGARAQNGKPYLRFPLLLAGGALVLLLILHLIPSIATLLLVIFGGVVLAVFCDGVTAWIARRLHLGRGWALALFLIVSLAALALIAWLTGAKLVTQMDELGERLSDAAKRVHSVLEHYSWTRRFLSDAEESAGSGLLNGEVLGQISGVFSSMIGVVVNSFILLVIAVYLAANPALYKDNFLQAIPRSRRQRADEVLSALAGALQWWFVGRFASMAVIGLLTGLGLWIVGVPMALALGFIAGLFSFVPFIGPIVSAAPGIVVGWVDAPSTALYALVVYVAVQILESNLITPLIDQKAVSIPPALLIASQLGMGILFGFWGVLWAAPLTVVTVVLIQTLYVQDVLKEDAVVLGTSTEDPTPSP